MEFKKKCSKCKVLKTLKEFYNQQSSPDGKTYVCIDCNKEYEAKRKRRVSEAAEIETFIFDRIRGWDNVKK